MTMSRAKLLQQAIAKASAQVTVIRASAEKARVELADLRVADVAAAAMAERDCRPDPGRGVRRHEIQVAMRRVAGLDDLLHDAEAALARLARKFNPPRRKSRRGQQSASRGIE